MLDIRLPWQLQSSTDMLIVTWFFQRLAVLLLHLTSVDGLQLMSFLLEGRCDGVSFGDCILPLQTLTVTYTLFLRVDEWLEAQKAAAGRGELPLIECISTHARWAPPTYVLKRLSIIRKWWKHSSCNCITKSANHWLCPASSSHATVVSQLQVPVFKILRYNSWLQLLGAQRCLNIAKCTRINSASLSFSKAHFFN